MALVNLGTNWVRDKPISFTERLKSKSVIEGNSVLLSCFVTGKEPFVVLWYRRGIPLPRDEEENFHIRVKKLGLCSFQECQNIYIIKRNNHSFRKGITF